MSSEKSQNVQDVFLNHVRKNKTPVTVFLVNGVKLQGIITWFDNFCVLLRRDAHSQLVYKHAISTVMPAQPIQLFEGGREAERVLSSTEFAATAARRGRALVVHPATKAAAEPQFRDGPKRSLDARLEEAVGLARAIDLDVVRAETVRLARPAPATLFGTGKVDDAARDYRRKRDRARRRRRDAESRCSSAILNGAGRPKSSTAPD